MRSRVDIQYVHTYLMCCVNTVNTKRMFCVIHTIQSTVYSKERVRALLSLIQIHSASVVILIIPK
jgi:hypothetical protein